jgi:4-amino-4-deoxy-L-arabinose transferase-like glycosyltransferase
MDVKYTFGWDQVDNAWAAKNIIVNHEFPLVGMVAKGNTGFFIGPLYYYFVALFYWITGLNPVASQYIALTTSVFTFFAIFFVVKKIFNFKIALIACLINSVASSGFYFDSVQWPVGFLPGISLLIFYFLYKLLKGKEKYVLYLVIMMGLAFHIHFTAIFFPIIVLFCFPFFPRTKKMFLYLLLSIPLFLVWFVPNFISQMQNSSQLSNMSSYLNTYYHGFHLRRFMQLTGDGLIQFDPFLFFAQIKPFKILILPIFILVFLKEKISRDRMVFVYLTLIFFLVPWLVFSVYRGEISDYYFSINRYIVLFILSYLLSKLLFAKMLLIKVLAIILLVFYSYQNLNLVINYKSENGLKAKIERIEQEIKIDHRVEFQHGASESYIYYYLMKQRGISVY